MGSESYRAAIIGLGFIGGGDQVSGDRIGQNVASLDGHHREAWMRQPRVKLAAGCDFDEGRRSRFAAATGANVYSNWQEMLEKERPDIVSIASYTPSHAELAIGCAERGVKAIYCEKPISTSPVESDAMIAACDRAGALLVINHNRRFNPHYRRLRELITTGGLGDLTTITIRWATGRLGCVGTHFFDAVRMLTGQEIVSVSGTLDRAAKEDCRGPEFDDPGGWGLLRLDSGLRVTVHAANYAVCPAELYFAGTLGEASTGGAGVVVRWRDGRSDRWWPAHGDPTSMDRTATEIIAWLDGERPFSLPAIDSAQALEAIVAFHLSHDQDGAWIALPLTGEQRERRVISG